MMDWIKCTDRMPPDGEPVIVTVEMIQFDMTPYYLKTKYTWIFRRMGSRWEQFVGKNDTGYFYTPIGGPDDVPREVTHWMPMPSPAED